MLYREKGYLPRFESMVKESVEKGTTVENFIHTACNSGSIGIKIPNYKLLLQQKKFSSKLLQEIFIDNREGEVMKSMILPWMMDRLVLVTLGEYGGDIGM